MHRCLPLFVLLTLSVAACGSSPGGSAAETSVQPEESESPVPNAQQLAGYDASQPLNLAEESEPRVDEAGVSVHDVAWDSPGGGRVSAWLVVPPGTGPFAGLVYQHGSETDRDDLMDEAVAMAHGGAVSVVVDAPFARTGESRRNFLLNFGLPDRERDMTAQALVDLRRAFDVLEARGDVDSGRLGFVGHSWGASLGVVLAAVDERPGALVLIAGRPSWTGFLATSDEGWVTSARGRLQPGEWEEYLRLMAPLDAAAEIANVDVSRLYLQYGTQDDVVDEAVARAFVNSAPGVSVDFYPAGHALDDAATVDRVAWLAERLDLAAVPAEVLAAVGLPDE